MCAAKGLPVGGGKDDRIARIVDEARSNGELDATVSLNIRSKRKDELMLLNKDSLVTMCEQAGVDPFVKEIIVERIISHESEGGAAIAMIDEDAPSTKKRRLSKK